nr:pyridoxal-phosphate dependent enzyme [Rhabdobacter roseus]
MQAVSDAVTERAGVQLFVKRDDLLHPTVSGNKWRKLKYLLQSLDPADSPRLLTFGGAHSNHLYALAAAGAALQVPTVGIVRGEEYAHPARETSTLRFCREQGMELHFVSREHYRQRHDPAYLQQLQSTFRATLVVPEGGTTSLALPGVRELVQETEAQLGYRPIYYAVAAGTGGTAAGILSAGAQVLAFSALKGGHFLEKEIEELLPPETCVGTLQLFTEYHQGGYGRHSPQLLAFIQKFEQEHGILLEQVYTGKLFFGLYDLLQKGYFPAGSTLVAVHTGGLQGRLPGL